ncbi:MAG: hypothetical protein EPN91_01270 [Salinibacterium sp.]|nr:MAG: hypothetical protein EPN91_01270 [Salinibacterium sp.]
MIQEWWNAFVQWFNSADGQRIVTGTILPFVAILAAGIIAATIARRSVKRLLAQQERRYAASQVAALIASGRKAAVWSSLSNQEQEHVDRQYSEAEVRVRLLPVVGAAEAADWSAHEVALMRKNSVSYSAQAEQDLVAYQDSLVAWQKRPRRMKKVFAEEIAAWSYISPSTDGALKETQQEWAAETTPLPRTKATAGPAKK